MSYVNVKSIDDLNKLSKKISSHRKQIYNDSIENEVRQQDFLEVNKKLQMLVTETLTKNFDDLKVSNQTGIELQEKTNRRLKKIKAGI